MMLKIFKALTTRVIKSWKKTDQVDFVPSHHLEIGSLPDVGAWLRNAQMGGTNFLACTYDRYVHFLQLLHTKKTA